MRGIQTINVRARGLLLLLLLTIGSAALNSCSHVACRDQNALSNLNGIKAALPTAYANPSRPSNFDMLKGLVAAELAFEKGRSGNEQSIGQVQILSDGIDSDIARSGTEQLSTGYLMSRRDQLTTLIDTIISTENLKKTCN